MIQIINSSKQAKHDLVVKVRIIVMLTNEVWPEHRRDAAAGGRGMSRAGFHPDSAPHRPCDLRPAA